MTELRRHRPQGASTRERRFAPHLVVLAMLVTFLPHCLFGCSMAMESAAMPMPAMAVMDCCETACPMDHADQCVATEEGSNAPDAVLVKSDPAVSELVPVAMAVTPARPAAPPEWAVSTDRVPHSPPVPLHLLNAQFLI